MDQRLVQLKIRIDFAHKIGYRYKKEDLMRCLAAMLFLCLSLEAAAQPAQVLLIRHAEKPKDKTRIELSLKGYERAAALVPFFVKNPEYLQYGPIEAIYAQLAPKPTSSIRPIETVTPLAKKLGQKVITTYRRDDYERMVNSSSR